MITKILNTYYENEMEHGIRSYLFRVPDENFDLIGAIKKASTAYLLTREGAGLFEEKMGHFTMEEFEQYVPADFCKKFEFYPLHDEIAKKQEECNLDDNMIEDNPDLPFGRTEPDAGSAYLQYLLSFGADPDELENFLGYKTDNFSDIRDEIQNVYEQMPEEDLADLSSHWENKKMNDYK